MAKSKQIAPQWRKTGVTVLFYNTLYHSTNLCGFYVNHNFALSEYPFVVWGSQFPSLPLIIKGEERHQRWYRLKQYVQCPWFAFEIYSLVSLEIFNFQINHSSRLCLKLVPDIYISANPAIQENLFLEVYRWLRYTLQIV